MPFSEEDLIPISALQHYLYCTRRAALVHTERLWHENIATTEGQVAHERAHEALHESRGNLRIRTGLILRSYLLGLVGKTDVVEFYRTTTSPPGISLHRISGFWIPYPVEYKKGVLRREEGYEIQLCAQALCLEEMLETSVLEGSLYWGTSRRRQKIEFTQELRKRTMRNIESLRGLLQSGETPPPLFSKKCKACSLYEICMPKTLEKRDVALYWEKFFEKGSEEGLL